MQALGLVRISEKQNFIEILFTKNSECEKMGLGPKAKVPRGSAEFIAANRTAITLFVISPPAMATLG